jgi:hypothetical protein
MDTSTMQRAMSTPALTKPKPITKPVTLRFGSFADGQGHPSDRVGRFVDGVSHLS